MQKTQYRFQESQGLMPKKMLVAIVILLFVVMGLFTYIYISQEFFNKAVGENSIESHWALIIFIATALLTFYVSRLKIITQVSDTALMMSLGVLGKRKFPLESIETVSNYEGNPAADFLGFGYRIGIKQTGYVGRADSAIVLKLKDQKRDLVITTQQPDELTIALTPDN
jgi:hypothetical protein